MTAKLAPHMPTKAYEELVKGLKEIIVNSESRGGPKGWVCCGCCSSMRIIAKQALAKAKGKPHKEEQGELNHERSLYGNA